MVTNEDLVKMVDIANKKSSVHIDFLKHILLISSSLFGILVALQTPHHLFCVQFVFSAALLSLSLGILCGAIALYAEFHILKTAQKLWSEELIKSLEENRKPENVSVPYNKVFSFFESTGYILLVLAILLLALFSILFSFV